MNWEGRATVLRREMVTYVDMPLIYCTGKEAHMSPLALTVRNGSEETDADQITHDLEYAAFPPPYVALHQSTNLKY